MFGRYTGTGDAQVTLHAKVSGEHKAYQASFNLPQQALRNPEIERLCAYASIRDMQDMIDYLGDESEYRSAIIDTAVQHGLVTDYTSMVVMRDEQFDARHIDRNNRDRRNVEVTAAQQRATQPVRNTRVDQSSPAFNGTRPRHSSGGGSIGMEWLMLALLMLSMAAWRNKKYS